MMLTMGGVPSSAKSSPRRPTEVTCLGIAGTVEIGRRTGGGSEYTSTGGSPITGTILSGEILERMNNSIRDSDVVVRVQLLPCFCICRCYRLVQIRA